MPYRPGWRAPAVALFAALALFSKPAFAQPKTVAEIANYSGGDRHALLEAGARREAALMIYMTGTQIQPLLDRYRQKYPYVKIESSRLVAADTTQKTLQEYASGLYQMDVFELAIEALMEPRAQGVLQPFTSPEMAAFDKEAIEPQRHWVSVREGYMGIGYNTDKIPAAQAPKTYDDLLDPKWKGRMALSNSVYTGANWLGPIALEKGDDFVRKLAGQNFRIYPITARAIANLMISGEVEISPMTFASHVIASNADGAHLGWIPPGPLAVIDTVTALAAKAPHPHAAMLLIDFLMSKEGQLMYRDLGYESARTDMPASLLPPVKKMFLANRPTYMGDFDTWTQTFRSLFERGAK